MPYTPTVWVDGTTPVNAANLNKLEQAIDQAHDGLPPAPANPGDDGKWIKAQGGAMVWEYAPFISYTLFNAKGDLIAGFADDSAVRVPAGTVDGQVLTRDAAQSGGMKWAAPAAGGADLSYDGDWAAGTYQDGDIVVKDGIAYLCVGGPTTVAPDPAPWGAAALARVGLGVGFPASPQDGQEFILVDSIANASWQWRFRYNAQHTGPYKWEFIGGAPAFSQVLTDEATSSAAPVDLATVGPQIIVPRAGEYWAQASAEISQGGATHSYGVSFDVSAVGFNVSTMMRGDGVGWRGVLAGISSKVALAAGTDVRMRYATAAGTMSFFDRRLAVYPVRLA